MTRVWRILVGSIGVLIAALAILTALFASFLIIAFVSVWINEGRLQKEDIHLLVRGVEVTLVCAGTVGAVWWIGRRVLGSETFGSSFSMVSSKSGRSERLVMNISTVAMFGISAVWLYERALGNEWMRFAEVFIWVVVVFLALHIRVLLHELGHLGAAHILGMHKVKIQIGAGRLLWGRVSNSGLRWEWRLWPQIGLVYAGQTGLRRFKWRQLGFVAAGPFVDACLVWAGYALIARNFGGLVAAFTQSTAGVVAFILFWLTTISAVNGLTPHRIHFGVHKIYTDGYWLFRLFLLSDAKAEQLLTRKGLEHFVELARQARAYSLENAASESCSAATALPRSPVTPPA